MTGFQSCFRVAAMAKSEASISMANSMLSSVAQTTEFSMSCFNTQIESIADWSSGSFVLLDSGFILFDYWVSIFNSLQTIQQFSFATIVINLSQDVFH